jgi:hypothetical protein
MTDQSLTKLTELTKTKTRDRGNTQKSLSLIIGRDFLQNVTIKLLSLCELSALCERPPHILGLMHNPGPLPMRESLTGLSALGDSLDFHVVSKVPVVDTEVDPPQPNSRPIRLRIVSLR